MRTFAGSGCWKAGSKQADDIKMRDGRNTGNYVARLNIMIDELKKEYGYNELDSFLVLKDILASVWKERKK